MAQQERSNKKCYALTFIYIYIYIYIVMSNVAGLQLKGFLFVEVAKLANRCNQNLDYLH